MKKTIIILTLFAVVIILYLCFRDKDNFLIKHIEDIKSVGLLYNDSALNIRMDVIVKNNDRAKIIFGRNLQKTEADSLRKAYTKYLALLERDLEMIRDAEDLEMFRDTEEENENVNTNGRFIKKKYRFEIDKYGLDEMEVFMDEHDEINHINLGTKRDGINNVNSCYFIKGKLAIIENVQLSEYRSAIEFVDYHIKKTTYYFYDNILFYEKKYDNAASTKSKWKLSSSKEKEVVYYSILLQKFAFEAVKKCNGLSVMAIPEQIPDIPTDLH